MGEFRFRLNHELNQLSGSHKIVAFIQGEKNELVFAWNLEPERKREKDLPRRGWRDVVDDVHKKLGVFRCLWAMILVMLFKETYSQLKYVMGKNHS